MKTNTEKITKGSNQTLITGKKKKKKKKCWLSNTHLYQVDKTLTYKGSLSQQISIPSSKCTKL